MARPIKVTPVLKGKESKYFNKTLSSNIERKFPKEERERILNVVNSVTKQSPVQEK